MTLASKNYTVIPYDEKYRDDMIFMVLEAKDALGRVPRLNEDLLDVQKNYIDTGDMFWLAIDENDRVVGCIGYNAIPGTNEVKLHRLYIKAARKRQGIGTCLLHTVELYLQERGKTAVHVHLGGKEYFESHSFYPKHGYQEYALSMMKKELQMELWDLYNERRELTGLDHIRGEEVPQGFYHLVVNVWIRNSEGKYLISQRSADRPTFPLMWECVGGSVTKGEDSLTGALRETKEEVGLSLSPEDGKLVYSVVGRVVNGEKFNDILDVWLFEYDGPVSLEQATTKEVAQTVWMTKEQIRELFDAGKLVHTLDYFFWVEGL